MPDYTNNPFNSHVLKRFPSASTIEACFGELCWDAAIEAAVLVVSASQANTAALVAELNKLMSMKQREAKGDV